MLDGRYKDIKNGRVQPVNGEDAFARLRHKSQDRRQQATLALAVVDVLRLKRGPVR